LLEEWVSWHAPGGTLSRQPERQALVYLILNRLADDIRPLPHCNFPATSIFCVNCSMQYQRHGANKTDFRKIFGVAAAPHDG
jgi:hypothetical protein